MKTKLRSAVALGLLTTVCGFGYVRWGAPSASAHAANPLGSIVRSAIDEAPLIARVEERLNAGSYTYLALRTDSRELKWAVTLGAGAPVGARVSVRSMGHKTDFHSQRLQRTFSDLTFGIVSRVQ